MPAGKVLFKTSVVYDTLKSTWPPHEVACLDAARTEGSVNGATHDDDERVLQPARLPRRALLHGACGGEAVSGSEPELDKKAEREKKARMETEKKSRMKREKKARPARLPRRVRGGLGPSAPCAGRLSLVPATKTQICL